MYIYIYFFFLLVHVRIFDSHFFSSFLFFFINSNEKKQSSSPHLPSLEYLEWVFQILILNDHRKILKLRYTFFNFSLSFSFRLNRLSFDWHIDDGGSRIPSNFNENRIRSEESDGSFFFFCPWEMKPTLCYTRSETLYEIPFAYLDVGAAGWCCPAIPSLGCEEASNSL